MPWFQICQKQMTAVPWTLSIFKYSGDGKMAPSEPRPISNVYRNSSVNPAKNYSTEYSRMVSHFSTDSASRCLTSGIWRDLVFSSVCGRSWMFIWVVTLVNIAFNRARHDQQNCSRWNEYFQSYCLLCIFSCDLICIYIPSFKTLVTGINVLQSNEYLSSIK